MSFEMMWEDFLYGQTDEMPPLFNPNPNFKFPIPLPEVDNDGS
jgi:hypothetical protein